MVTRANIGKYLAVSAVLLSMAGTTFAQPLLFPMHVGLEHTYQKTKGDSTWYIVGGFTERQNLNSTDYYLLESWDLPDGTPEPVDLLRSTEDAVYSYDADGDEYLQFQKAPVGTKWTYYDPHSSGKNHKVIEIVAIEQVTIPYGTFENTYKHRKYRHNGDGEYSPDWYEWIVPGVGMVKQEDWWTDNPPVITELASVHSELGEEMTETLVFFDDAVEDTDLEGVGPAQSAGKRLNALRNMLENTAALIEGGFYQEACDQLWDAYGKCDGDSRPPDLVEGDATDELAGMILEIIDGLGCE